jgi:hypothetical protein
MCAVQDFLLARAAVVRRRHCEFEFDQHGHETDHVFVCVRIHLDCRLSPIRPFRTIPMPFITLARWRAIGGARFAIIGLFMNYFGRRP